MGYIARQILLEGFELVAVIFLFSWEIRYHPPLYANWCLTALT